VGNMLISVIILWTLFTCPVTDSQWRLFWTNILNDNDLSQGHDCLYRHESLSVKDPVHEVVPYCIRSSNKHEHSLSEEMIHGNAITFDQMKDLHVTSEDLYPWLAPIDLIENYKIYLNNPNDSSSEQRFFNCTSPWFGTFCEYSFNLSIDFNELVWLTFNSKEGEIVGDIKKITNYSCYEYILCNRGPTPVCLDWREICDGKIDCIDGGADEEGCDVLEANECRSNEYRCHNGLCVPADNFHDSPLNPDCLDGSDEPVNLTIDCMWNPSFRCEERMCRHSVEFSCGDGTCTKRSFLVDHYTCPNERDVFLTQAMTKPSETPDLSDQCWQTIMCATNLASLIPIKCSCHGQKCATLIKTECISQFTFPGGAVMFGHVYFIFMNNRTKGKTSVWLPDYICYNDHLCPFLPSTIKINGSTCREHDKFGLASHYNYFFQFTAALMNIFRACSAENDTRCHQYSDLFHCDVNLSKCI
jgi:hypothetical protein